MSIGTARLCPFCSSSDESQQHFLSCHHGDLQTLWKQASDNISRKLIRYNSSFNRTILRLIGLAVTTWKTTSSPARPDFLPQSLQSLFDQQSRIGWDQISQGRFAKTWTTTKATSITKTTQLAYVIHTIWKELYAVWISRCSRAHGTDTDSKRRMALLRLTPQVEALYKKQEHTSVEDQYIFKQTIEETLNLPTSAITNWIFKAQHRLHRSRLRMVKASKQQLPIHPFFSTRTAKPCKISKAKQKTAGRRHTSKKNSSQLSPLQSQNTSFLASSSPTRHQKMIFSHLDFSFLTVSLYSRVV